MDRLERHKNRIKVLEKHRATAHIKSLASDREAEPFLSGEVDQSFLQKADVSQAYSKKIDSFDLSVSSAEVDKLLSSLEKNVSADTILEPVFLSLLDGMGRAFNIGSKQGFTATRLYKECVRFDYSQAGTTTYLDSYTENLNELRNKEVLGEKSSYSNGEFFRENEDPTEMRDGRKMKKAKESHMNGEFIAADGYNVDEKVFFNKAYAKSRGEQAQAAEADHAVSCAEIANQLKDNKALNPKDISDIINIDDNIVVTSKKNNAGEDIGKSDKSREQLQKELEQGFVENKEGKKTFLNEGQKKARANMVSKMREAQKSIDKATNDTVVDNILNFNNEQQKQNDVEDYDKYIKFTRKERKKAMEKARRSGESKEDRENLKKKHKEERDAEKETFENKEKEARKAKGAKEVRQRLKSDALDAAAYQAIGDLLITFIKPLYFELNDCFKNGIEAGVDTNNFKSALKIRFNRIKSHLMEQATALLKDGVLSFFKNFLSMLLEGIVNCFVGVFKQVARVMKEGVKSLFQIMPILRNEETSPAQKGDAILKLIAGSITVFAGIGIEAWLNSLGLMEPWSIVVASVLSAVMTTLVMYILDRIDLFGVNRDLKLKRISEVLEMRITEHKEDIRNQILLTS